MISVIAMPSGRAGLSLVSRGGLACCCVRENRRTAADLCQRIMQIPQMISGWFMGRVMQNAQVLRKGDRQNCPRHLRQSMSP